MNTSRRNQTVMISFCTTCCNRWHQFSQILDANIAVIDSYSDVEWIIMNFGSTDALDPNMERRLPKLSPRIVYAKEVSAVPWHASIAKNAAHRIGRGKILMNLDCDNLIGNAVEMIRHRFTQGCRILHQWSGAYPDGTYGRIAIRQDVFHALGGYDESFAPMGYQDSDLLCRARASGIPIIRGECNRDLAIPNTKKDGISNCAKPGQSWRDYNEHNKRISQNNILANKLIANGGRIENPHVVVKCFYGGYGDEKSRREGCRQGSACGAEQAGL
jgi:hypothetical protein